MITVLKWDHGGRWRRSTVWGWRCLASGELSGELLGRQVPQPWRERGQGSECVTSFRAGTPVDPELPGEVGDYLCLLAAILTREITPFQSASLLLLHNKN